MNATVSMVGFFQQEALESLTRLDMLLAGDPRLPPDAAGLVTHARALRGTAAMTPIEGFPALAETIERVAQALLASELRWGPRLHVAVQETLGAMRGLVARAAEWGNAERETCRTEAETLARVATAHIAPPTPAIAADAPVVPISQLHPNDGLPGILQRNPAPARSVSQRFRQDLAFAGGTVAEACASADAEPSEFALEGVRHALLALREAADSYSAASIVSLTDLLTAAPLDDAVVMDRVRDVAQLCMRRDLTDAQLAMEIKQRAAAWRGAPSPTAGQIVPIESLLYRGHAAIARARQVRDALAQHWTRGSMADPAAHALFEELSDLLNLAVTT